MLTSQEFRIVNAVMEGRRNDATVDTQSQDSWNQGRDSALQTSCLSQYLLHASDVRLIKKVGNGAFGEVFKGTCLGQTVAVKTMRVVNDENVRCFRAEILLTATLRHPNIVNFVGACWGKELICLVLEWVPKGTLGDLLADVALDLRWDEPLLRLATDIARGMAYLHGREYYDERDKRLKRCILHRDLKPQNALVTEFSGAKLADFGSSRAKGTMDATMTAVGTPLYAAPELMRGEAYDETIDVYSFGILLIDMASYEGLSVFLRGRWCADAVDPKVVHPGEVDVRRVLLTMWDQGWRPVTAANGIPAAPPSVVALLQRCFAHDPRERPPFPEVLHVLTSVSTSDEAGAYRRVRPQAAADRDRTTLIARGSATTVDDLAVGRDGDRYSSRGSLASPRPSVQPSGNRASWNPIHQRGSEASDHRDLAGGIGPPPRTSMAPPPLRQPPLRQPPRSFFSRIGLFTGRRSTTEPVDPKEEPLLDSEQGGGGREPSPRRLMKIPFYRRAPRPEEVPLVNPEPTVSHL
jgi:serine/threonine protein kinase